jgi:hypothetical protein
MTATVRISMGFVFLFGTVTYALEPQPSVSFTSSQLETASSLLEKGLNSDLGYRIVESLTTEVGPRLAGSEAERRARDWALRTANALSFDKVLVESFTIPYWTRGENEHIEIVSPFPQPLEACALGGSGRSTSDTDVQGELVYFASIDELEAVKDGSLSGKIAYVDGRMTITQTGEGYVSANLKRQIGWQHAERAGALAIVIRSVGTDSHRFAHTGMVRKKNGNWPLIPAFAVSAPDADQLYRLHQRGINPIIRIHTQASWHGERESGNIILDLKGRENPEEIILIGAHLDSWDLGTGAVDDGAGIGIVMAAAELIGQLPQRPRRTIRVVLFGAEEVGLLGAKEYAKVHNDELADHIIASESDFGARKVWKLNAGVSPESWDILKSIHEQIRSLGILFGDLDSYGGPDIIPLVKKGVPTFRLLQDGRDYFHLHHTSDDTFDKIEPDELSQNVAAWAVMTYLLADSNVRFRPSTEKNQ